MKKFLTFLFCTALLAVVVSCSSSTSSPSDVVETLAKCMKSGNYDALSDVIYSDGSAESTQMKVAVVSMLQDKGAKTVEEMGGIKSYEILSEEISEDGESAEVAMKIVYGNGNVDEKDYDVIMKDGKWYLEISK